MRLLILAAAVATVAWARPGTYKENEDFQYSKSSTDEGSKSGYYGAQRGNVGGNYERAHNMDTDAQKQMSTAIKHVEGDLGHMQDADLGSVFTAGNTHQSYGHQGYHDLSNLQGRSFQESDSAAHSGFNSHSSMLSAGHNGGYAHNSRYSQRAEAAKGGYNNEYARQSAYNQAALDSQFEYDQAQSSGLSHSAKFSSEHKEHYESKNQNRMVNGSPVRIVLRPAHTITVPVAAELYDNTHSASFDQNSINSDAEVLSTNNLHHTYKPATNMNKNYESSYSYRKEWEKHDEKPVAIVPVHSELVEDASENQYHHSYRKGYQAASEGHSRHNSAHNSHIQQYESAAADSANVYGNMESADSVANTFRGVNSGVKSPSKAYQSSYSYHKSWERQGDPYVIEPASERLTAQSASQNSFQSHQYGSHASHASHANYGHADDCVEDHHHRVVRSYNSYRHENDNDQLQQQQQQFGKMEDLGQQQQNSWGEDSRHGSDHHRGNLEEWGQQAQTGWANSADLTQQSQNQWGSTDNFGQLSQKEYGNLEDLSQHVQGSWDGNYNKHNHNNEQLPISNQRSPNEQQRPNPLHTTTFLNYQDNDQAPEMSNQFNQPTFSLPNLDQELEDFGQENLGAEPLNLNGNMATSELRGSNKVQPVLSTRTDNQLAQVEMALNHQHKPEVKPTWEQSEDNTQQSQQSYNDWSEDSTNQRMFTYVSATSHRPVSLQKLWNKIDNLEQQSSDSYGQSTQSGANRYNYQHSYQSWQQSLLNDSTKSPQQTTSSSTVTPINNTYLHGNENYGRGDIGQDNTILVHRTTEKDSISTSNRPNFKLPESGQRIKSAKEIEARSLVEGNNKVLLNSDSHKTSEGVGLGVISLEQQRLNEQGQGHGDQHKYLSTSTVRAPKYLTYGEFHHVISHEQSQNGYGVYSDEQISTHNFDQQNIQSQSNWGEQSNKKHHNVDSIQKTEGLSQRSDSEWSSKDSQNKEQDQNKNLENSDNTQQSQVHSFGNQQEATNNFYEEKTNLKHAETHQNIESTSSTTGIYLQETTTVKPGFWKSTKDKVYSWFKRS